MKLFYATATYLVLGLASGLFYREFTKTHDFSASDGFTQLSVVHTHILTLGVVVLLIALVLEKVFVLSRSTVFDWFFWIYNVGLVVSAGSMVANGIFVVLGMEPSKALAGISGSGHILLSAGLILLMVALGKRIAATPANTSVGAPVMADGTTVKSANVMAVD